MKPPDFSTDDVAPGEAADARSLVFLAVAGGPEPCAVARADGSLAFVNPAMLLAAGLDPAGPPPADLCALAARFGAAGFDNPAGAVAEVLRTGRDFESDVTDFESGRTLALRLRPVGAGPAPAGVAFTARDVTRRRDAERLRAALASLVSHELRTPLTSIGGFADLLAEDDALPAEAREFLGIIREETGRLTRMVGAFFGGVQPVGDGAAGDCEPVSLGEVAREAVAHFAREAAGRGVPLALREGPRLPPVAAGRRVVERAVAALLGGAVRRAAPGTGVLVSTALEAAAVTLSVESRPTRGAEAGHDDAPLREAVGRHGGRLSRESEGDTERVTLTFPRL